MPFVSINNKQVETDRYGRIIGAVVHEQLHTSTRGIIEADLIRRIDGSRIVIEADMWQSGPIGAGLDSTITTFRAGVYMRWENDRYRIESRYYRDCNEFWQELERLLSNVLMTHE